MFWLSLIASLTGIISFIFSLIDRFKKWRSYFIYSTFLMIGLTIGVVISMSEMAAKQFTTGQVIYLIALVALTSFSMFFIYRFLNKTNEIIAIVILIFLGIYYFTPRILNSIQLSQDFIKPIDYLTLANHYESNKDYMRAANFLERYKELDNDNIPRLIEDSLTKRIFRLKNKAVSGN